MFGHALFEGAVLDNRAMVARSVVLDVSPAEADEALAAFVSDRERLRTPDDLPRAPVLR